MSSTRRRKRKQKKAHEIGRQHLRRLLQAAGCNPAMVRYIMNLGEPTMATIIGGLRDQMTLPRGRWMPHMKMRDFYGSVPIGCRRKGPM